jgi:hypothetical protein
MKAIISTSSTLCRSKTMFAYKAHMEKGLLGCAIEELGPRRLADVGPLIASMKEPACEFFVGFYKIEKRDFVEVSYVGNDQYLVWSDRLTPPRSLFARLFGSSHINKFVQGDEEAFEAVKFYVERSRQEFEERYYRTFGDRPRP